MSADPFAPASDHARSLASSAAEKAKTERFAKALSDGKSDLFKLNPFLIRVEEGFNSRDFTLPENEEHVDDLARSIASEGVRKPIEVRFAEDGQPYLVDGECRLRATIRAINVYGAEIDTIPALVSPKGQNDADRVASQFVSNSGKPFNELEASQGIRRLIGYGWDERKIADRTGLSPAKVSRLIKVLEMPEEMKGLIRDDKASVTLALDTTRREGTAEKAMTVLKHGIAVAAGAGKERVTAKHIARSGSGSGASNPASALSALREAFRQAEITREDGAVSYTLTEAGAALVRQHLGV